jgi:diguanylate cyclase (GGDEF)-like protein/PAS domain S-box-containing protein
VTGPVSSPDWRVALLDQGVEAVIAFDDDARLVYASEPTAEILGYDLASIDGTDVLRLVHPDDLGRAGVNIQGLVEGARPLPGMLRIKHAAGHWITLELTPWRVVLPGPPDGPGPITALVLRDNSQTDTHWAFLAALASGDPFDECAALFAHGLSSTVDGPLGISFEDRPHRRSVGPVQPLLAGVDAEGLLDATPGTPWAGAVDGGEACWSPVADLPQPYRRLAEDIGAAAAVAVAVPDPGAAHPALLVQWPPDVRMGPILAEALRRRPREAIAIALDRRAVMARLERLALSDALTEVANRTRYFEVLSTFVDDAVGYGVCFVDLDHLKPVNDTHGHKVGDDVIVACARRLERAARSTDLVARLGGDEFAIACPGVQEDEIESIAARIVALLSEPVGVGEQVLHGGGSVGCAVGAPGADPDAVMAAADAALYEAKRAGRGRWRRGPTVAARVVRQP